MNYEEKFLEYFNSEFAKMPDGKWFWKKDPNKYFVCMAETPAKEFKSRYKRDYKEAFDKWFDEVHPY